MLFSSNWSDSVVTERMLKYNSQNELHTASSTASIATTATVAKTSTTNAIDSWYRKMRQTLIFDHARYFENRGFIRLKDATTPNVSDTQTNHFIKWIQQDGFIYVTISLEEVFVHVKFGYCTRYRAQSRQFFNEINHYLSNEFHIQSCSYDYHLSAVNRNFSPSTILQSQINVQTLLKFLEEFYRILPQSTQLCVK